jgi:hypothetical protein
VPLENNVVNDTAKIAARHPNPCSNMSMNIADFPGTETSSVGIGWNFNGSMFEFTVCALWSPRTC